MRNFCLLTFFLFAILQLKAQPLDWLWSTMKCQLPEKDAAFLVETEKQFLLTKNIIDQVPFCVGAFGASGYYTREQKISASVYLSAQEISNIHFVNYAELSSKWNYTADTCVLIGFQPMILEERDVYRDIDAGDTTCWMHAPLFYYQSILERSRMKVLHDLALNNFAASIRAIRVGDTLLRLITFKPDSNQYLPQADYILLCTRIINAMRAGFVTGSHNKEFSRRMTSYELERTASQWDSTNHVEDPNNPGTWIIAPIKSEKSPEALIVYEKWIPDSSVQTSKRWWPTPYLQFSRKVLGYGVRYANNKIIWVRAADVYSCLTPKFFNWTPYEESFRAERFETMHIELEP